MTDTTPAPTPDAPQAPGFVPRMPANKLSRAGAIYALHRGIDARQAGKPVTACPWNPDDSVSDFFVAHWWIKGWRQAGAFGQEVPKT